MPSRHAAAILSLCSPDVRIAPLNDIAEIVAGECLMTVMCIKGPSKYAEFLRARFILYYVLRHEIRKTFPQIGRFCGGRDHATIINGVNAVAANMAKYEPELSRVITKVRALMMARGQNP